MKKKSQSLNYKIDQNRQKCWQKSFHFERMFEFSMWNDKWNTKNEKKIDFIIVVFLQKMNRIYNRILIFVIDRFHTLQTRYEVDLISIKSTIQFSYHLIEKNIFVATKNFLNDCVNRFRDYDIEFDWSTNISIYQSKILTSIEELLNTSNCDFLKRIWETSESLSTSKKISRLKKFVIDNLNN